MSRAFIPPEPDERKAPPPPLANVVPNMVVPPVNTGLGLDHSLTPLHSTSAAPRQLEEPPARLDAWLKARNPDDTEIGRVKNVPPAMASFGAKEFDDMIEIGERSGDYQADPRSASAYPPVSGGMFKNVFTKRGEGHSALMMENYRAQGKDAPAYTASDAFLNQWAAAHAVLGSAESNKAREKSITTRLGATTAYASRLPDTMPTTIYRQNISGDAAKEVLGGILGSRASADLTGPELELVLAKTVNGKATRNIVSTFNEVKRPASPYRITGGALNKDSNGNFQLRFDIGT